MGGLMDVLIPRNSKVPARAGGSIPHRKTGNRACALPYIQGERDMIRDDNRKLAEFNPHGYTRDARRTSQGGDLLPGERRWYLAGQGQRTAEWYRAEH